MTSDLWFDSVPILALVDGDPYGIDILSVYKFGSTALKHEQDKLAAGRVEWVGVWASELAECVFVCFSRSMTYRMLACRLNIDKDALIPISRHDEKKVCPMTDFYRCSSF